MGCGWIAVVVWCLFGVGLVVAWLGLWFVGYDFGA